MNIEKKYFPIEKVEEVKIYDLSKEVIFYNSPKVTDVEPLEFESILNQISSDVNQFIPVDNGEDLIVTRFGKTLLQRLNINPRRLSLEDVLVNVSHFIMIYSRNMLKKL